MKLLFFGDSLTAGHEGLTEPMLTAKLKPYFSQDELINKGVNGHTTNDAMKRFTKDVLVQNPDIVVIQFGSNDSAVHKHVPREMYQANLEQMVKKIGPERCVLITPPPVDESLQTQRSNQVIESYGEAVKDVALEYGTGVVDLYKAFMEQPNTNELLKGQQNDGLHYGDAGYELVVKTLVPAIEERKQILPVRKVGLFDRIRNLFA